MKCNMKSTIYHRKILTLAHPSVPKRHMDMYNLGSLEAICEKIHSGSEHQWPFLRLELICHLKGQDYTNLILDRSKRLFQYL